MMKIFIGYDPREAQAWHACAQSIIDHASRPPEIVPLALEHLGTYRETHAGTNSFIHSRFLVPALCDWQGIALYVDADILFRIDPFRILDGLDRWKALHVVQHDYMTQHPRKYLGSPLEAENRDYPRKNWSSVILWNCGHYGNRVLTPEKIEKLTSGELHRFGWLAEKYLGALDPRWNVLVGEQDPRPDAYAVHYTLGVPTLAGGHYAACDYAGEWHDTCARMGRCG
jgi:hypothetical protein